MVAHEIAGRGCRARRVFTGPKAGLVTTMKRVSIANLSFAVTSAPLLYYITNLAGTPVKGVAMSALLLAFGGGTTGALMYATKTYVKTITTVPGSSTITVVTPTFLGGDLTASIEWSAIQRCEGYHPFATFEADGRTFYLDELGEPTPEFQEALQAALGGTPEAPPDGK